jgi:hypothetical protein
MILKMTTITFDTHELIKELKQSGFNEEQAEGLSLAFRKTQDSQLEKLATKHDLKEIELEIKSELSDIKAELKLIKWGLALVIAVTVLPVLKELFS